MPSPRAELMAYRRFISAGAVLVLAAALAGCGKDAEVPASGEAAVPAITIQNFAFVPPTLRVIRGQQITVTNQDEAPHTITAVDGSFDSGNLAAGESITFVLAAPGTTAYICDLHQYMKGSIDVL